MVTFLKIYFGHRAIDANVKNFYLKIKQSPVSCYISGNTYMHTFYTCICECVC